MHQAQTALFRDGPESPSALYSHVVAICPDEAEAEAGAGAEAGAEAGASRTSVTQWWQWPEIIDLCFPGRDLNLIS